MMLPCAPSLCPPAVAIPGVPIRGHGLPWHFHLGGTDPSTRRSPLAEHLDILGAQLGDLEGVLAILGGAWGVVHRVHHHTQPHGKGERRQGLTHSPPQGSQPPVCPMGVTVPLHPLGVPSPLRAHRGAPSAAGAQGRDIHCTCCMHL